MNIITNNKNNKKLNGSKLEIDGYYLLKSNFTKDELNKIKNDLTVIPQNNDYADIDPEVLKNKLYKYDKDKEYIIVPRYYAQTEFGFAETDNLKPQKVNINFTGKMRDYQVEIVETCLSHIKKQGGGLLCVPCAHGKCMKRGSKILMYDGCIKNIEDVQVGDLLMGDDSTKRKVLSLAHGYEEMYDIISNNKIIYTVNKSHILSLKHNNNVIDISINEYLLNPDKYKHYKGYRNVINFESRDITYDEQNDHEENIIGVDGNIDINNIDNYLYNYGKTVNDCILTLYKCNSTYIRTKLLKGLIENPYIFTNKELFNDIVYVIQSLGYNYYIENGKLNIYEELEYCIEIRKNEIENEYFGFEIDGNKRYVLGDFSITHNTSMAIYMASVLGVKTLFVTHKTFLQNQLLDRCKFFTTSKVGIIRQDTVDVKGKDIVIAMAQSLYSRNYDQNIFKDFGLLIVDEAHHFGSRCFSSAISKINTKYTIGLTATPNRTDGLINVVKWYLGNIMFQKKLQTNNQVIVKQINFYSKNKLFTEKSRFIKGEMKPDCIQMTTNLINMKNRTKHLIKIINELRKDSNRKILILSGRKDHLKEMKEGVDKLINKDINNGKIFDDDCKTCFYTGETKEVDREYSEKYGDVLFATYNMAHEGLDIDRLNTIILATPKKDVVQAVGRILRKILQNGDIRPLIIDFTDDLSVFKYQSIARSRFYKQTHYNIHKYYICENEFVSMDNYNKYKDKLLKIDELEYNTTGEKLNEILKVDPVDIIDESKINKSIKNFVHNNNSDNCNKKIKLNNSKVKVVNANNPIDIFK